MMVVRRHMFGGPRIAALAIVLAVTGFAPAQSQSLSVSLEETGTESRVALGIGDLPFSVERSAEQQVDFVSPAGTLDPDLSQFGGIRAASRVTDARLVRGGAETRIRFLLDCACPYSMSLANGVVSLAFTDPAVAAAEIEPEAEFAATASRRPAAPGGTANAPASSPAPIPRGFAMRLASDQVSEPEDDGADVDEVQRARDRLLEQLSRAADQGLLDLAAEELRASLPDAPDPLPPVEPLPANDDGESELGEAPDLQTDTRDQEVATAGENGVEPRSQRPGAPPPPAITELSLRARTAYDKAFRPDRAEAMAPAAPCLDERMLDPRAWDSDKPFFEAASALRASLLDEFDQPQRDAVLALARLHLVWGLGAETRQILRLYGAQKPEERLLADLAEISDGRALATQGYLSQRAVCGPRAAMWRLAAGFGEDDSERDTQGIIGAFAETPPRLRGWLGPMLMANALDAGDVDLADGVDQVLRRGEILTDVSYDLAFARLKVASGDDQAAEAIYHKLAASRSPASREALLRLFDGLVARGETPSVGLADALDDAAYLARGGAYARSLGHTAVVAMAMSEGLPRALETVRAVRADERRGDDPLAKDAIHAAIEAARAPLPEDVAGVLAFVEAAERASELISDGRDGDAARVRLSVELVKIGMANLASEVLAPSEGRTNGGLALARAKVALGLDDGAAAIEALAGVSSSAAAVMRAAAYERLGDAEAAHRAAAEIATEDMTASASRALRAGVWAEAAAAGAPAPRILAAYMAGSEPAVGLADPRSETFLEAPRVGAEPTLRDARRVLEASASSRELILEALSDG